MSPRTFLARLVSTAISMVETGTTKATEATEAGRERLTEALGGAARARVIVVLASVLGLSSADVATVGASATELRHALSIGNTDIGLLVTVTSLVGAVATLPFGVLADRVRRTWTLAAAVGCWGAAMIWSAAVGSFGGLLLARLFLGVVTAASGPLIASLTGDFFPGAERGRVYGYILAGDLVGAGFGFGITGDVAALSWRAAFAILAVPAFLLAWAVARLPEPARGGGQRGSPRSGSRQDGERPAPAPDTDAQQLAAEQQVPADPSRVLSANPRTMNLLTAARYVLRVRTNVILIIASACGYYFLAGVEVFGTEFAKDQYHINQAVANLVLLGLGVGAIAGVLTGGRAGDAMLRRRRLNGRILASALAATGTVVLFIPAIMLRDLLAAMPYLVAAAFCLSAQNPPLDAARLDIMPALLWGRAEAIRTVVRSLAQSLAPLVFGAVADHVFGGGRAGLQATFGVMLVPLAAGAVLLYRALRSYPGDVATAAAAPPPGHAWPRPASAPR